MVRIAKPVVVPLKRVNILQSIILTSLASYVNAPNTTHPRVDNMAKRKQKVEEHLEDLFE
jgi:hypothetical protein